MIENCLRHKIIRDFLRQYTENRWKDLIPSLIQIGILNLQKSFNKMFFTIDELKKVLRHLQISQIEKDKERNREKDKDKEKEYMEKEYKENEYYENIEIQNIENEKKEKEIKYLKSPSLQKETPKSNLNGGNINTNIINVNSDIHRMKILDIVKNYNQEKIKSCNEDINETRNNKTKLNYHYYKNNMSIDFKNKLTKQKNEHYKKINIEYKKNNQKKYIDKISYAISYDKDLRPESISKKVNTCNNTSSYTNNNTNNNTNINVKTDYDIYNSNYNSGEKNIHNKDKNKKRNKEKFLNLNNLNKICNTQNVKRRHYNLIKQNFKNYKMRTGISDKNNLYKKLNAIQSSNLANSEMNNNYTVVKIDKILKNKIKTKNLINTKNSNSCNNNYYKNLNFINTLYQKVNTNGEALKNNNYFSNRDELDEFIQKNRIKENDIFIRKDITKSEKPIVRTNNFMNIDERDKIKKNIYINSEKNSENNLISKNFSQTKRNSVERKTIKFELTNNNDDIMKMMKNNPKTPKKNSISNEKKTITEKKTNDKNNIYFNNENIIYENYIGDNKEEINNTEKKNDIGVEIKAIKLFDTQKDKNDDNAKNFEKVNGKYGDCRYFNVFGYEGEDISLTQIERDCSGIIDSSTSNEIQLNPDYFFKDSPRNVFKGAKSSNHSYNSNNNEE